MTMGGGEQGGGQLPTGHCRLASRPLQISGAAETDEDEGWRIMSLSELNVAHTGRRDLPANVTCLRQRQRLGGW